MAGGRQRAARPERLEEEYYGRERYQRYPREYPRDHYHEGYGPEYPPHGEYDREAYGHDYTRDTYGRDEYAREAGYPREAGYAREERGPRQREREAPDEYGASRRALNAV